MSDAFQNRVQESSRLAVSATELATCLGVSLRHVRRLDALGKLPEPIRLGRSVRWPVAEIDAWLAAGAPDRHKWNAMRKSDK